MPKVAIDDKLAKLVAKLSTLRIATPLSNPNYKKITKLYIKASDDQTKAINKAIDAADKNYKEFSAGMELAIKAVNDAIKDIEKIAEAIKIVAKVVDIGGKIIAAAAAAAA
jgi:esterase/lipase